MTKRMREILSKIETKNAMAKEYMEGENKDLEKAEAIMKEVENLQKEFSIEEKIYNSEKKAEELSEEKAEEVKKEIEDKKAEDEGEEKEDTTKFFAKAVRTIIRNKDLNETTNQDGGYTVPEEISTEVKKLREAEESLMDLISIKKVNTLSGEDTYKTRGQATGFGSIEEGGKLPKITAPKFSRKPWKVTKYGGYLPVTNELLKDSDANIRSIIVNWLASESRATWNNLILTAVKTKEATDLKDLDGIKKALNVTLSLFKNTSVIVTNDDGIQYLDTLKDANGRYLLEADPTAPTQMRLRAGARVVPVKQFNNSIIPTTGTKVPFIIGDLKEGIKGYDREQLSILASNVAVVEGFNAFEQDMTLIRGIEREDIKVIDDEAFVNGYIDTAVVAEAKTV